MKLVFAILFSCFAVAEASLSRASDLAQGIALPNTYDNIGQLESALGYTSGGLPPFYDQRREQVVIKNIH
jgi:hypothetical protein